MPEMLQRYLDRILVAVGVVVMFFLWHFATAELAPDRYTPAWMDERILIFAAIPLILAVLGFTRSALAISLAYPVLVIVGDLVGGVGWGLQELFLGEDAEPKHFGWYIAVGLYAWTVIAATYGEWRGRRDEKLDAEEAAAAQTVGTES